MTDQTPMPRPLEIMLGLLLSPIALCILLAVCAWVLWMHILGAITGRRLLSIFVLCAMSLQLCAAEEIRLRLKIETVNGQPKIVVLQENDAGNYTTQVQANIDLVLDKGLILRELAPNLWLVTSTNKAK